MTDDDGTSVYPVVIAPAPDVNVRLHKSGKPKPGHQIIRKKSDLKTYNNKMLWDVHQLVTGAPRKQVLPKAGKDGDEGMMRANLIEWTFTVLSNQPHVLIENDYNPIQEYEMTAKTKNGKTKKAPAKRASRAKTTKSKKAPAKSKKAPAAGKASSLKGKKLYKKVKDNPRRKGTHGFKAYALIKDGMTYEAFIAAADKAKIGGGGAKHLRWEIDRGRVVAK